MQYTSVDPTLSLILAYDSFTESSPIQGESIPFKWDNLPLLNSNIITSIDILSPKPSPRLINLDNYSLLWDKRKKFQDIVNFDNAKMEANPFENIGNSIFMNRAGIKLVNIDAIYGLTKHVGGLLAKQTV